jgi:hypothetical protein
MTARPRRGRPLQRALLVLLGLGHRQLHLALALHLVPVLLLLPQPLLLQAPRRRLRGLRLPDFQLRPLGRHVAGLRLPLAAERCARVRLLPGPPPLPLAALHLGRLAGLCVGEGGLPLVAVVYFRHRDSPYKWKRGRDEDGRPASERAFLIRISASIVRPLAGVLPDITPRDLQHHHTASTQFYERSSHIMAHRGTRRRHSSPASPSAPRACPRTRGSRTRRPSPPPPPPRTPRRRWTPPAP